MIDIKDFKPRMRTLGTMGFFKKYFQKPHVQKQAHYREKNLKILFMGKDGCGKTSMIRKLCDNEEFVESYTPTLYEVYEKCVVVDDFNVHMQFMDLGGSHTFPSMQEVFIKQADIFVLVYATGDVVSYEKVNELRDLIVSIRQKHTTELPILVVRTKTDLRNKRTKKEQGRRKAVSYWCPLTHDVSSKSGVKINAVMDSLIEESKFIGHEKDLCDSKISGRYIFKEDSNAQASEVYHKAPTMFREHDNSDEKMEKRRRKSMQHQNHKGGKLLRSISFAGIANLRRTMSRRRTHVGKSKAFMAANNISHIESEETSSLHLKISTEKYLNQDRGTASSAALSGSPVYTSGKHGRQRSKSNSLERISGSPVSRVYAVETEFLGSNSQKVSIAEMDKRSPNDKQRHIKPFCREQSAECIVTEVASLRKLDIEPPSDMPNFQEYLRRRRKSASHTDISTITAFNSRLGERSRSFRVLAEENKRSFRPRSISVGSKEAPRKFRTKLEIVHTTLNGEDDLIGNKKHVEILPRRFDRQISVSGNRQRLSRSRRLSVSTDNISEGESENFVVPPNHPLIHTRRRSVSHNDLSNSILQFREHYHNAQRTDGNTSLDDDDQPAMGRKKTSGKKSILKNSTCEIENTINSIERRKRSVSFGKYDRKRPSFSSKKYSIQSNMSVGSMTSSGLSSVSTSRSITPQTDFEELSYPTRSKSFSFSNNDLSMIHESADSLDSSENESSYENSAQFKLMKKKNNRVDCIRSQSVGANNAPALKQTVYGSPMLKAKQWIRSFSNEGTMDS